MKLDISLLVTIINLLTANAFTQPRFPVSNILIKSSTAPSDNSPLLRIGHGFDIHRLIENKKLVIGECSNKL